MILMENNSTNEQNPNSGTPTDATDQIDPLTKLKSAIQSLRQDKLLLEDDISLTKEVMSRLKKRFDPGIAHLDAKIANTISANNSMRMEKNEFEFVLQKILNAAELGLTVLEYEGLIFDSMVKNLKDRGFIIKNLCEYSMSISW